MAKREREREREREQDEDYQRIGRGLEEDEGKYPVSGRFLYATEKRTMLPTRPKKKGISHPSST